MWWTDKQRPVIQTANVIALGRGNRPCGTVAGGAWTLAIIAIAVRLIVGLSAGLFTEEDSREYLRLGYNLAHGHGYSFSASPPYTPTDYRMPGYPALIAVADWLHAGYDGIVVVNVLLGALTTVAMFAIARRVFAEQPRLAFGVGLAAALYPTLVAFAAVGYSENLYVCAICWFIYAVFFQPTRDGGRLRSIVTIFVSGTLVAFARSEGIVVLVAASVIGLWLRNGARRGIVIALALVLIAPVGWALRNDAAVGRLELTDPVGRDMTLLLSFNNGRLTSPLFHYGLVIARDQPALGDALPRNAASVSERGAYHDAVISYVKVSLRTRLGGIIAYKAKSLAELPFVPIVWQWSTHSDYAITESASHVTPRNLARLAWGVLLLLEYCLALGGLVRWWQQRRYRDLAAVMLYPVIVFGLAIPFHAELRLWFPAALLLLLPAGEGAFWIRRRWREG